MRRLSNALKNQRRKYGQGQNRTADTRIFSSLAGAGLYDTIGRYMYLFKRLKAVLAHRFYRFEHIVSYSSGKVTDKVAASTKLAIDECLACVRYRPRSWAAKKTDEARRAPWCGRLVSRKAPRE